MYLGQIVLSPGSFVSRKEKMFESRRADVDKFSRRCYKSNIRINSNYLAMEVFDGVGVLFYTSAIDIT